MQITSYKKKDGKTYYAIRVYLGTDPKTGKERKVMKKGFSSRKDAQLAYHAIVAQDERKESGQLTFREVYEEWLTDYRTKVKESTLKFSEAKLRLHILPYIGGMYIGEITRQDAQRMMDRWSKEFASPGKVRAVAVQVFNFAKEQEYIDRCPFDTVKTPRNQKSKTFENYYDRDQLRCFLAALDQFAPPLWRAYFYTLALTGMRRAEALALDWSDIDFSAKTIRINKAVSKKFIKAEISSPKTAASNRTISIGDDLIAILLEYRGEAARTGLIFPNSKSEPITLSLPTMKMNAILKKAGLPHLTPHGLRHTHCCLLFEAGASIAQVQHRLGHADVKITLEVYNHITRQREVEVPNLLSNYLNGHKIGH
ncbi:MAG: tyrosine-type recombinase/integrase [Bacillota bacterium]|nr:tyrosine-type recombinase/integrase [Bacillota bacterium]